MPTQIIQKTESLDFTEDNFVPQVFTPPESPPDHMFPKYIWVPEGTKKEVSSTPSKPPEVQTAQLQTVRPEELFRPATSLESSRMHWSLGGGLGSHSIEAMSLVPPSPTVTNASSASDVSNVCVSPAIGDKRKAIDATDASINAEAHVIQKCRMMGPDENFGPKDDGEQINGTDYGTNIVAADGLSPDLKFHYLSQMWQVMITISRTGMRVNLLHHCQDITVFASRPSLSASFIGAVSDFLWPDVEGIEVDSSYLKPQATHLVIEGEQEEGIGQILVNDFVEQLTALHTAQLNFMIAGRVQTMAWKMPSLQRLYLWNSSVSPEGLQVLMKLLPNLTHFAVGGQDMTRIVEDHFGDDLFHDGEILKTLPPNLVFLHIDVVALVREKTSKTGNGVCPRTIHWLTLLDNHVPITTLELKLFTNDIRVSRNLLALCASTIQTIKLYFVDMFVGSVFVDLSNMQRLQHFHILTSELWLHKLLNVVRTIRSPDFEDVNICTALTSFEHTFAGLKFWDNAYASQELRAVEVVNLSILVKELQPWTAVHSFYGELVTAQIPHMREDNFIHVFWFKDGGFLAGFADTTDCHCVCD
ncbi:hypothetical protein EV421DRAFT_1912124 [Armillaria borealis]|uniref:Uncharacterized protein n=1 Tax=Armillaria borealis TaxID=47425 RepID=A0AA39IVD2_9AGAR|nr:hypothetical protein EV421DRAFT_1912124 [Armillaria borealis]